MEENNLIFSVNYNEESFDEKIKGKLKYFIEGKPEFKKSFYLKGRKVLNLKNGSAVGYLLNNEFYDHLSEKMTIEIMFKLNSCQSGSCNTILGDSSLYGGFKFYEAVYDNSLVGLIFSVKTGFGDVLLRSFRNKVTSWRNKWHHAFCVFNKGVVDLFLDGKFLSTTAYNGYVVGEMMHPAAPNQILMIGGNVIDGHLDTTNDANLQVAFVNIFDIKLKKEQMLSEQNILANVRDISAYFNITRDDIILISRPLYHCAVLTGELLVALSKGVQIRFSSEKFNPKSLIDLIREKTITVFCGTPTMINAMTYFMRDKNSCKPRVIVTSGECMSVEVGKNIRKCFPDTLIYNVYGQTEAAPRISYLPPEMFSQYPDSVGLHLASLKLKIIKENGENAKTGEEGILWVSGPNVMMGYFNNPEETSKVLKNNWLCTGDIAVIGADGLLRIKGRSDDLIIRGGMNIYPIEIENEIRKDPRVEEVSVFGINNSDTGTQIGMKISGKFKNADEVKKLCIEVLPSFQIPAKIELLEKLPKNASGKIIRSKIND